MRFPQRAQCDNELLPHESHSMGVVPAKFDCHRRLIFAVLVHQPALLANLRLFAFFPKANPGYVLVGKPDGTMMIMIRRGGVSHASQRLTGWTDEREEERSRVALCKMPS